MTTIYVLYEHSSGYALFKVKEIEDIGSTGPKIQAFANDVSSFTKSVKLVGYSPFVNATVALESLNSITEGIVPATLREFLAKYLPKEGATLGISDVKLAPGINEAFKVKCLVSGALPEIVRGIRQHFHHFVQGFSPKTEDISYLGLGHSYSRAKIKFNVHKTDNMIIQSIALLDQLDKDINTFSMRIREWYSYHFPELYKIVPENYLYAKAIQYIKNRKDLDESKLEGLEEILMDSGKAQSILNAARHSMGMDIQPLDLLNINSFVKRLIGLADYRKSLAVYLHDQMNTVAPNLSQLIGDQVGARLISHAGSLTNLAKYPASTVQILGAEKALFRALKTKSNTPKYGLIFHSTFIGRANAKNKGRVSRFLANKCSIASRIDCFSENSNSVFGEKLRQQVEDRLKFYETGEKPKKNVDVMEEAINELVTLQGQEKKVKKKKKRKTSDIMEINGNGLDKSTSNDTEAPQRKKKIKVNESAAPNVDEAKKEKKKKKKRFSFVES